MIHLVGRYYLNASSDCYSLEIETVAGENTKNPGQKYYTPLGSYHTTIEAALRALIRILHLKEVRENDGLFSEMLEKIKKINEDVEQRIFLKVREYEKENLKQDENAD